MPAAAAGLSERRAIGDDLFLVEPSSEIGKVRKRTRGNALGEDNHSSITAITCPPTEKRQPLPPQYNALVTTLKAKFDQQYQDYLAAGGTPHRLTVSQRWALDTIRKALRQEDYLIDFIRFLGTQTDWSVAYAVCYIQSEIAQTGLLMKKPSSRARERLA